MVGPYLLVIGLTLAILTVVLRLWDADLAVPSCDRGDSLCAQAWIKSVQDHGWFLHNPDLGAPWGADLYDYPLADDVHFLVIRAMSVCVRSPATLFNLYFLLQFPLIACTSFFVLRRLEATPGVALVASILYAMLPFHLLRGLTHFLLASYYLVPFQVLLIVRLGQSDDGSRPASMWRSPFGWIASLVLCFLVGGAGIYYAFFGSVFYLLAGLFALLQRRNWYNFRNSVLLSLATLASVGLHLAPQITYLRMHGMSLEAVNRAPTDSELLGLKIAHLLLPVTGHRSAYLAAWKSRYLDHGLLNNENLDASLGLLGSIAFLYLLVRTLRRRSDHPSLRHQALDTLTVVNLGAVLLSTIGGFGVLISLFVSGWIRAYNRISVFVAFFAFAAAAIALTPLARRLARNPIGRWTYGAALILMLAFGIWDQTSPGMIPNYARLKSQHESDTIFVNAIEHVLPPGAMILELPYVSFPEAQTVGACAPYDHLKPYLASHSLRWSFAAFRGRPADVFVHLLSSLPPANLLRAVAVVGFEGIVVDRFAYQDRGWQIAQTLSVLLHQPPTPSSDGRWAFFPLNEFRARLRCQIGEKHWHQAVQDLSRPILPVYGPGFSVEEGPLDGAFRWAGANGEIHLCNSEGFSRMVELEFDADRLSTEPVQLEVISPCGKHHFVIGYGKQRFHIRLEALPGATKVCFVCDGKPVESAADSRKMVFRLANLTVLPESVP
jgi:phosphoglycerol transferase